jgi:Domain of unknown function (DUF5658)
MLSSLRRTIGLSIAILALASSVSAQSVEAPKVEPATPDRITFGSKQLRVGMYVSFATLQALDGISTLKALDAGGREANPMMSRVVGSPAGLFAVKAATTAATVLLSERLAKHNEVASFVMMAVLNTGYAAIVAHNYRAANVR